MAARKLLVVTGDYAVVQQVKQSLGGKDFAIQTAYSHFDAIYQLKYETFDLVLVDAAMTDRKTGGQTAAFLTQTDHCPPLLVYAPGANTWPRESALASLDEVPLLRAVATLLRLPALLPNEAPSDEKRPAHTSIFWRDEEMQTLFALGRSLTEVLDLSEVLNRVVEAARSLTNAEEGMILLPDGQSGQLYLRAKVGIDQEVADNFRIRTHDTIAGTVFESGQPILVGESGPQKVKTEYFVNSLLYVPINHKGQILGVLGVNNKTRHDIFTDRHRDLLINLASYAAVAIENARIHGQSIRRAHELKTLIDAGQVINASLSFDHTLPAICRQLVRVLNVNHAEIYTWDAAAQALRLLARSQEAWWRGGQEPQLRPTERPVTRLALEGRRPVYVQVAGREPRLEDARLRQIGASATLALPLLAGEQVLGVLQAYFVHAPANPVANETISRAQRLVLEKLALARGGDTFERFGSALEDARTVLGADWIEYVEVEPRTGILKLEYAVGSGVWSDEPRPTIDTRHYADLLDALELRKPLNYFLDQDELPAGARLLLEATNSRSLLALPLIGRGQTLGLVLFADTLHARAFSSREIDLGRAIVGQAATALENVGLVRDLEVSLQELKEAQARLVQSARLSAMGELAAAVAHQINNPLTTIVLDTELLLEIEPPDTRNYEVLSAISRAGKRAAGVVRRLLAMARPIAADAARSHIDVLDTINDVAALVRPHIEREGMRLITQLPNERFPNVLAVPGELNDVWLNLILNAHDAVVGRAGPEIGVTAAYDPQTPYIEVSVWDNGPGIPTELVNEIFKPFFTTKPPGEGTGLGLHICRQVVDRIGGVISVQTSPSGTRFMVRLPIIRST